MRIAVFGGTGFIGSKIVEQLTKQRHDVVIVARRTGDVVADYTDPDSVESAFEKMQPLDGVIVTVGGDSVLKSYEELTDDDYRVGAERKFLANVRIVRIAEKYLEDNGSITLTSGLLSHYPIPSGMATGAFNIALDTFVEQVAPILSRGIRLNVVSPGYIVENEPQNLEEINIVDLANLYVDFVEGDATGRVGYGWGDLAVPPIFIRNKDLMTL